VLATEAGLHVLESESQGARAGGVVSRVVARVRVASAAAELSDEPARAFVVRRYRFEPSPLVRDARRGWRSGRVREVMAGNFDLFSEALTERETGARG
jgi:ATP-dependent Clp protease ATP-binding subunit ClpC